MKKRWLIFLFIPLGLVAQNKQRYDSLRNALAQCPTDTCRVNTYHKLGRYFLRLSQFDSCNAYAALEIALSQKAGYTKGLGLGNSMYGSVCFSKSDNKGALEYRKKSLALFEQIHDSLQIGATLEQMGSAYQNIGDYVNADISNKRAYAILSAIKERSYLGATLMNLGAVAFYKGDYPAALDFYIQALKIYEEDHNDRQAANVYINVGNVYNYQNNVPKAIEMYKLALEKHLKSGFKYGIAVCYMNLGELLAVQKKSKECIDYFNSALTTAREINNPELEALTLYNLGSEWGDEKDYEKALRYYFEALDIQKKNSDQHAIAQTKNDIGNVYMHQKKYAEARKFMEQALETATAIGFREDMKRSYASLSELYETLGDYKNAFEYQRKYAIIKDSIYSGETTKQISEMGAKYETEKKEKENEILRQKDQINSLESSRKDSEIGNQRIAIAGVGIALLIMIALAFFILKGYRQKQRDNLIIESQKALVEEKNKDITDSIHYAQRIQEAMLPAREIKYRIFPNAFVLFEPRDIVSGDFYWFTEKNGRRLIAAVDCTGHGVPGAFMSLIGNAFLHEVVNEKGNTDPPKILGELRDMVVRSLRQTGAQVQSQDGMDIALLSFDDQQKKVAYAGANNPLWIVGKRGNGIELEEYSANKRPIGYYLGQSLPFEGHIISLKEGDALYIFTDGFADQFGGPGGKKFKYKQFQELLVSIHHEPMNRQEELLREAFTKWKGELAQVDDVLVIGIKV